MRENIRQLRHILFRIKAKALYTSAFGRALRRLSWKDAEASDGLQVILEQHQDAFAGHTMNHISDPAAIARFKQENDMWSRQTDRIYRVDGDISIEPEYSLAYMPGRKFIVPSRSKAHLHMVPSLLKAHLSAGRRYAHYDALIHFDGYAGRNLYHFFDDAVNPLLMLLGSGLVDPQTPALIHEQIYRIPYVQYILGLSPFRELHWVIQKKGEWIKTGTLYKAISSSVQWQRSYELLQASGPKHPHRKIFLNRKAAFQRRLLNNDAIEAILQNAGFETVYAEDLSYPEQVALFAETSHLVAIHGAGVTNLLHSDLSRTRVLEIFSESLLHPHFYWFLELLRIGYYDAIVGGAFDINWNFSIDAARFEAQLRQMLEPDDV